MGGVVLFTTHIASVMALYGNLVSACRLPTTSTGASPLGRRRPPEGVHRLPATTVRAKNLQATWRSYANKCSNGLHFPEIVKE